MKTHQYHSHVKAWTFSGGPGVEQCDNRVNLY